ncbi:hypothetical protein BX661DRAFT_175125 [Kickxella alabastrina]|uniref:uncharacterized protein n=1 Tax=Kickxella alabastrina TaxID=61397 RepID=UPI00221FC373|nr:uncharacterized protein BX661DRAFT_175125 [Kickxella alabastrina]KAI7834590.1 hypothetical protein BX661DRAFT_175125 [Kickxella alabastrina]
MPRKSEKQLKLSRQLISMSWNPRNLYQLATKKPKRDTRGYHDANITEKQWLRMFKPQLPTLNMKLNDKPNHPNTASLMYACMERRLDFIVFRSHFASSIWMARQMIIHGKVKLNGKKLPFPSHTVQDGDVIAVDPEAVVTLKAPANGAKELDFVNYNTCSTVFLREPVTRPNVTEVPSPFPPEFHALSFEFYLRRGRTRK